MGRRQNEELTRNGGYNRMKVFEKYKKELEAFEKGKSSYEWDELEELMTDDFEEERLSSEEFDSLMQQLMGLEPE